MEKATPIKTFVQSLAVPLWPVRLLRPMNHFMSPSGLAAGEERVPHPDLLAAVVFSQQSFKAMLRRALGDQEYRNARNFAVGKSTKSRTATRVADMLGLDLDQLRDLFREPHESFGGIFYAAEGALYRVASAAINTTVSCPCCGGDLFESPSCWWRSRSNVTLESGAYRLVDRILMDLIVLSWVRSPNILNELAKPDDHPHWQWLRLLHDRVGGGHIGDLVARKAVPDLTRERIWAMGRGETLDIEAVESLVAGVADEDLLRRSATSARGLSLASELLMAASAESINPSTARQVLHSRLRVLLLQFDLTSLQRQGRLMPAPCKGALPLVK
jgi:hypothetical protein